MYAVRGQTILIRAPHDDTITRLAGRWSGVEWCGVVWCGVVWCGLWHI